MITSLVSFLVAAKTVYTVAAANVVATAVDDKWAVVLNTALLVILALLNQRTKKEVVSAKEEVVTTREEVSGKLEDNTAHILEAKANTTHAASSAAAAAASAATAARIASEAGAIIRRQNNET